MKYVNCFVIAILFPGKTIKILSENAPKTSRVLAGCAWF